MAEIIARKPPSDKRVVLSEAVPLQKPLCIRISPISACNLKCSFCSLSVPEYREKFPPKKMTMDFFIRIVDDIKVSFGKVKRILMPGIGEFFLHPQMPEMLQYLMEKQVCDNIELITNGALITPEIVDRISGVRFCPLVISVNGLSDEDFFTNCGVHVSFNNYVENLRYLYKKKGESQIYIKIINYMVQDAERKQLFFDTFEPICDRIGVESLLPIRKDIDYEEIAGGRVSLDQTQFGNKMNSNLTRCSMCYYTMQVQENGDIIPCCYSEIATTLGNVQTQSLREIWQGQAYQFQYAMLNGVHSVLACNGCTQWTYQNSPEDYLDGPVSELKKRYDSLQYQGK